MDRDSNGKLTCEICKKELPKHYVTMVQHLEHGEGPSNHNVCIRCYFNDNYSKLAEKLKEKRDEGPVSTEQ